MNSIIYLQEKLEILYDKIPSLQITYEYRKRLNTHIIHILPEYFYEKDSLFAELQIELEDDFEEKFIDEEIMFITNNELISIENPIFSLGYYEDEVDYSTVLAPEKILQSIVIPESININWGNSLINSEFEVPKKKNNLFARFTKYNSSNNDEQISNSLNLAA